MTRTPLAVATVALALAITATSCSAAADQEDLSSYVGQLRSDAAQGVLLVEQASPGRLPGAFTRLSAAELEDLVEGVLHELKSQMIGAGLTAPVQSATRIADALLEDFEEIDTHANQRAVLASLGPSLKLQARSADLLYDQLR